MALKQQTQTKSHRAYQLIKEGIQNGVFVSGKRLTEGTLTKKYNLGRVPVREALLKLGAEGFLQDRGPHRGMYVEFVEDVKPEEIIHRYDVREIIEAKAASLAAKNMNGWQIDQLRQHAEEVAKCKKENNREGRLEAQREFHEYLMVNCGNPLLHEIWQTNHLAPLSVRSVETESKILGHSHESDSHEAHNNLFEIVDAISSHDPEAAENVVRKRVQRITEKLRKYFW